MCTYVSQSFQIINSSSTAFISGLWNTSSHLKCSIPEVVGDAALMVNPYKIEEIAEAIESAVADLKKFEKFDVFGNKCMLFENKSISKSTCKYNTFLLLLAHITQ